MSDATSVPGMLSLSYHVIYDDAVQAQFREDWVSVATEFSISDAAKAAIAAATRRGTYSADDARAICACMDQDLQQNLDASIADGDASGSDVPPVGMLSAVYHVFAAGSGIPLSAFDLNQAEEAAIQQKDQGAIESLLFSDFNQRYEAIYTLAW